MPPIDPNVIYSEAETLLSRVPPFEKIKSEEGSEWLAEVASLINLWDIGEARTLNIAIDNIFKNHSIDYRRQYDIVLHILRKAKIQNKLISVGPTTEIIETGKIYKYFEEVRKIIQQATQNIMFVDPYLDADFIKNYLPFIHKDVTIELLTSNKKISQLEPAAKLFKAQNGSNLSIKVNDDFHDRWIIVDKRECFQSGASIKDGAKNSPTTITQVVDNAAGMVGLYYSIWNASKDIPLN